MQVLRRRHGRPIQRGIVKTQGIAAPCLGLIHGGISLPQKLIDGILVRIEQRNTDVWRAVALPPRKLVTSERGQNLFTRRTRLSNRFLPGLAQIFEHHDKLVAADTRSGIALPNYRNQTVRDLLQQQIAGLMTIGISKRICNASWTAKDRYFNQVKRSIHRPYVQVKLSSFVPAPGS